MMLTYLLGNRTAGRSLHILADSVLPAINTNSAHSASTVANFATNNHIQKDSVNRAVQPTNVHLILHPKPGHPLNPSQPVGYTVSLDPSILTLPPVGCVSLSISMAPQPACNLTPHPTSLSSPKNSCPLWVLRQYNPPIKRPRAHMVVLFNYWKTVMFNAFRSTTIEVFCYDTNLLGLDWLQQLGLLDLPVRAIHNPLASTSSGFTEYLVDKFAPVVHDGLGLSSSAQVKLQLRASSQWIFRPKRPVPYTAFPLGIKNTGNWNNPQYWYQYPIQHGLPRSPL